MTAIWHRLPVAVRAVIAAFLALLAGNLPWGVLATANARLNPSFPWAALVMAWIAWTWQVSLAERRLDEDALSPETRD